MSHRVPFFDYPAQFMSGREEYLSILAEVLSRGSFILQEDLERFEAHLAEYLGVSRAFGVGNGTDAILIALRAGGVGDGDEVILPSHTFVATGSAVVHAGAEPVLVDVRDDHLVDPDAVDAAVTSRTKAIIPVQLNGRTCEMDALRKTAERHDLLVIEDAAQGLGSEYRGRKAGTFGLAGTFSFYPAKLLGAFGDAGAVVTDDPDVARRIAWLRDHGRGKDGTVKQWSYNSRLDNIQAAILDHRLETFPEDVRRRREIARTYHERLSPHEEILLPPGPDEDDDHFDVYQNYEIEVPERDRFQEFLSERGVGTIVQWGGRAIHQFDALGFEDVRLPVTDRVMARSLLLPLHPFLSDDDVAHVCDTVDAFFCVGAATA